MTAFRTSIQAFRESYFSSDPSELRQEFTQFAARALRYSVFWAFYENTAYRGALHSWSQRLKSDYGLYKYIRHLYNPTFRLVEFWRAHLWGGQLDSDAGDGRSVPSALPIETENELIRPAISQLWRWSNWSIRKDIVSLWGSALGDVGIKIVDDPSRGRVFFKLIHPASIENVTLDEMGNIKGYCLVERRRDPRPNKKETDWVTFREECYREPGSDEIFFATYLDDKPWDWSGTGAEPEWSEPYGFVPFVLIQHNNVGLDWGWSELQPSLSKFREVDDQASKLGDHVRKVIDPPILLAGVDAPRRDSANVKIEGKNPQPNSGEAVKDPESGRQEVPILYGPVGAVPHPLIAQLDIQGVIGHISSLLKELEREFPELQMDIWSSGDSSGKALRLARQRAETKVMQRRPNYDSGLVIAQMMGLSLGGYRSLPGFESFNLESYSRGDLDHSIGKRPVFSVDPFDDLELKKLFWEVAGQAKSAGLPLQMFLQREGWSDEEISQLLESPQFQAGLAALEQLANNRDTSGDSSDDSSSTSDSNSGSNQQSAG